MSDQADRIKKRMRAKQDDGGLAEAKRIVALSDRAISRDACRIATEAEPRQETPLDQTIVAPNEPPLEHSRPCLPVAEAVTYECGCKAYGDGVPSYCPDHGHPIRITVPGTPVEAPQRPAKASKPAKVAKDGRFAQTLEGVLPSKDPRPVKPPKKAPPRLPDQSKFEVTYHADKKEWHGSLTVYLERDGKVRTERFASNAKAVFTLLHKLDTFFRKWLASQKKPG